MAQLNLYQAADGDTKVLYKGYVPKGVRETARPLIPFNVIEKRLLGSGYSLIDEIPFPVIFETDEKYDVGDLVIKNGATYEVKRKIKAGEDFATSIASGKVKDKVPNSLIGKEDALENLVTNDIKVGHLRFASEILAHKEQGIDKTKTVTTFTEVLRSSALIPEEGLCSAEINGELKSSVAGAIALLKIKKGSLVIAEDIIKLEVANKPRRFSIKTKVFESGKVSSFLISAEFALENITGGPTLTATGFDIKLFGQIDPSKLT